MNQFTPFVFSTGRARNVAKVNAHAGAEAANLRWLVGFGEKTGYTRAGAAKVQEVGNLCRVMAFGIEHANKTKKPVVLVSDDVRGFFALVGPPSRWTCKNGRRLALSDFTARILASMRQVAAPLGGVTCTNDPRVQLAMPWVSYSHFFTMDFMVMDPPINFPVETHTDVQHKLDYGIIAAALAAVGAVCRLNRFSVDAPHFTTGGAGKLATRRESDKRACSWLIRRWGAKAFRLNPLRDVGDTQVIFSGKAILEKADKRLPALHAALYTAMAPTKLQHKDRVAAMGARMVRAALGAKAIAGQNPRGKSRMTEAQRQRLHRARKALREVVRELRSAGGGRALAIGSK